jgi:hypothetical protein
MDRYYLSGPMSGYPDYNHPYFNKVADVLRSPEYNMLISNPVDATVVSHESTYGDYIRADLKMLLECDGIIMLPGWTGSIGAKLELQVALMCGMKAVTLDEGKWPTEKLKLIPIK